MSVIASYPIVIEENADRPAETFIWKYDGTNLQDWTGWTAQMMIRANPITAPALTLTIALGGAAGTVTIPDITAAQASALIASLTSGSGIYDLVCTRAGDNFKLRFIDVSPVILRPGATK